MTDIGSPLAFGRADVCHFCFTPEPDASQEHPSVVDHQQRKDIQMFRGFAKKGKIIKIETLTVTLLTGHILRNLRLTSGAYG